MTFKTIFSDINKVAVARDSLSGIRFDSKNVAVVEAYKNAIKGLNEEQARYVLSKRYVSEADQADLLTKAEIISANDGVKASELSRQLVLQGVRKEQAEALIEQISGNEAITSNTVLTKEQTTAILEQAEARKILSAQQRKNIADDIEETASSAQEASAEMAQASADVAESGAKMGSASSILARSVTQLGTGFKSLLSIFVSSPVAIIATLTGSVIGLTYVIGKFQDTAKNAAKAASEFSSSMSSANSTYNQESDSLNDLTENYEDLREQLISAKGDEEKTYDIKSQLLELQEQLNEIYGDECDKVNLVTDAYKDQTAELKKNAKQKADNYLNTHVDEINEATKKMTTELHEQIKKLAEKSGIEWDDNKGFVFKGTAEEASKAIDQFMTDVRELRDSEDGLSEGIINNLKAFDSSMSDQLGVANEIIDGYQETYETAQMAQIASDKDLSQGYNEAVSAVEAYNDAVSKSDNPYDDENVKKAWDNLQTVKSGIQDNEDEWGQYSNIMDKVFSSASDDVYSFYQAIQNDNSIKSLTNDLQGLTDVDLQSMANDDTEDSFDKLCEAAKKYGLEVQDVIDLLIQLGIIQGKVQEKNSEETPILSLSETIAELDKVKEKMDVIDKTYAKLFDKDENIGFEDYSNIAEAFKDVSGIENYIDKLQKAGQNTEEVKKIMSSLTGAYIEQSGILDKVNEQNAGLIEQTLTEIGVENSHELVLQRLSAAKEIAALKSFDLANATTADILKLVEEGKVSEETANYLLQYALKKELANGTTLTTDSDIENIKKLVLALGGAIDELNAFQNAKNGVLRQLKNPNKTKKHTGNTKIFDEGSYSTESQEKAQDEIDSVLTKQYNYSGGSATSKAVNDAAKAAKDAAKDVKEAVAETFDFIKNGINRFDKALSKLEDKAGKTSSSFTSRLNAYKEALDATSFGIELLTDDYNKYMQKANEVGLSEDIASAVRGGASNIWDYSDDTVKQQIKDYQSWYDKAQDCLDKIDELKDKQLELTQASIELLITQYEKLSTKVENANDRMEKWISLKESWGFSANTKNYDSMNKNIQKQIDYINKQDEQLKLLQKTVTKGSEAWYEYNERIDSNKASLIELKQQMQENATAAAALAKATADKKTEKYDSQDELYDAKIDNATSAKSKNKLIDKKISNINKTQKAYNTAVSTDNKNLKSAKKTIGKFKSTKENKKILASIKKAAKSGKHISQSLLNKASKLNDNGKLYNACVQYNAYLDAKEADKATADLYKETAKQDKATLAKEKFDNISSDYENKISSNEQKKTSINNKISLAQEQGKQVSTAYYKSLISAEKGEQSKLIKERKKLQKSLNDAVISDSIKKGSDEWFEMVSAINDVTNAIDESTQSIVEFQNALRQLKWDAFDKSLETVKRINSEADYYIDLLSHKDMTDKDTGNFTEYGIATIGLHKTNYDNYIAQAKAYQDEYNNIMEQIRKGELSTSDENVIQRLRDLQDAHREAKKSAEDELESINDLVKQGYEAQTDALSKLIEKFKKLKNNALDYYKYAKSIIEKTKQIAALQKQLIAYNGNDSEESRATIQKLKVQLEESKSDLQDTIYERYLSDTEDMLDDLMNDYQEFIDEKLNDTNSILSNISSLLGDSGNIVATLKSLDTNLTSKLESLITGGTNAVNNNATNTITTDQNAINTPADTSSYDAAAAAEAAKQIEAEKQRQAEIQKFNEQRANLNAQIVETDNQLRQLQAELNAAKAQYNASKAGVKNKDKLRALKDEYTEKTVQIRARMTDLQNNRTALADQLNSLPKYAKGSKHINEDGLVLTQEEGVELQYDSKSGAIVTPDGAHLTRVHGGDMISINEMSENLWKLAKMNPAQMYAGQFTPVTPDFSKSVNNSSNIEVTFGDLVLPDVTNSAEFADSVESVMREAICKNGKTTQCITEAVSAKQLGKNGIGNARLYK